MELVPDVSIVIVNYNTYELTCNCIRSVIEQTKKIAYELILVDNGSTEKASPHFQQLFRDIKYIPLEKNLGFSKGNNVGIGQARGKYVLLLNSDTVLIEDSVSITFNYLQRHSKVGIASSKLIFPNGKTQSVAQRFPSLKYKLIELFRLQKLMPAKAAGKILLGSFFDQNANVSADWVWGAFFMFRKALLEKLPGGKLDDTYFMYCEDMQWCLDIKKLGYEVHFCANTSVIHLMGGSGGEKEKYMKSSGDLFMTKNYTFITRTLLRFLEGFFDLRRKN